jgi:hypothetical protein
MRDLMEENWIDMDDFRWNWRNQNSTWEQDVIETWKVEVVSISTSDL